MIVPYMASAGWYAEWIRGLSIGMPPEEAIGLANCAANIKGKDYARCRICGPDGELLLSIPVEGGAARLKRRLGISCLQISEHGNWRHMHTGALNAAYGRAPYFQHFMPLLADVFNSEDKSLKNFNTSIHQAIVKMLFGEGNPEEIVKSVNCSNTAKARGKEISEKIAPSLSIIDALMRFGKETTLALSPSQL